jgi:hypothetical protein
MLGQNLGSEERQTSSQKVHTLIRELHPNKRSFLIIILETDLNNRLDCELLL